MKRILSVIAAVAMLASLFSTVAVASTAPNASPLVTVTWYNVRTPQTDTQMVVDEVNKMLAEKTDINVKLDYQLVDWATYADKMAVMVQAGEPFDIMYAASWINYFQPLATKGALYPLNDLLDQYGQDIVKMVDADWLQCDTVNGKIYGIPNVQGFAQAKGITFNADLVDKYNFDYKSVKSLLDVEPFLQTIKENEPGITPLLPAFAVGDFYPEIMADNPPDGLANLISFDPKTNSLICDYEWQPNVDVWTKLHEWYQKGYIAKDAASKVVWGDEIRTQTYAVMPNFGYVNDGIASTASYGYRCYDVMTYRQSPIRTASVSVGNVVISSTSKQPDKAMQLINAVWGNDDIYNTLVFGVQGTHWNFKDEATKLIEITDRGNSSYTEYVNYQVGTIINLYGRDGQTRAMMDEELASNNTVPRSELLGFIYVPDALKNESASITAISDEVKNLLDSGTYDPAVELPKIIQRINDAGWAKVRDDCQTQIDAWRLANVK